MRGACLCGGVRFELTERPGRLTFPTTAWGVSTSVPEKV